MRILLKTAAFFIAAFTFCLASAQDKFISQSVDEKADKQFIRQVSRHLDKVRRSENRPTVALVLCGGGAKGAAEVGAMKYIEELGIPIDFVCGTSIGSLIGGLYSVGYDVSFIDSLFHSQDWRQLLSDKVDGDNIPISAKRHISRYQLNVPFSFGQKIFSSIDNKEYTKSLLSSLPAGYVDGVNVNNLFSALTVGYHDSLSFAALPIPFGCTATDLVSCKAKYWGSGELKEAMRSSMGIPGFFKPVRTGDMILSDGGTIDNFPVDIAKGVGADIIIGIDLSDPLPSYDEINNVGTVMGQLLNMLVETSHERQIEMSTVYIRPELSGYSAMSFNSVAVDTLFANGYREAGEHRDELLEVKRRTGTASTRYHKPKAVNLYGRKVSLREISFEGLSQADSKILMRKTGLDVSKKVDAYDIEKAIQVVRGTGAVASITYSLYGSSEPYRLVFNCEKTPSNRISAAARIDSEIWAEIALNLGINVNSLSGPKLEVGVNLGQSQKADVKFMLDYSRMPTFNFEVSIANVNGIVRKFGDDKMFSPATKYNCNYFCHEEKAFLSSNRTLGFDVKLGLRNRGYIFNDDHSGSMAFIVNGLRGDYLGCFVKAESYTLDHAYFPTRGVDCSLGIDYDFVKSGVPTFKPITTIAADIKAVIPCGSNFAVIPDIHYRSVFDRFANMSLPHLQANTSPEYSLAHRLFLGGDIQGRYIENQVPFVGFNYISDCTRVMVEEDSFDVISYNHMAVVNLDLRAKLCDKLYLSAMGGYARMSTTLPYFFSRENSRNCYGAALQLYYDSVIGPVKGSLNWSNRAGKFRDDLGFYLSVGFNF